MNQKNELIRVIRTNLEIRRKKLSELEGEGTLNNETSKRIRCLRKEIGILESELDNLL